LRGTSSPPRPLTRSLVRLASPERHSGQSHSLRAARSLTASSLR
jgi:hypothetical protein